MRARRVARARVLAHARAPRRGPTRFLNTWRVSCVKSRRLECIYGIGVYTPVAFVRHDNCPRARPAIGMILVSDSATPSAIVNQSACTEPHPGDRTARRALVPIPCPCVSVSYACGIASHRVVSRRVALRFTQKD